MTEIESDTSTHLVRKMGILGLSATGICSMIGAGINIVPFTLLRSVPGIGPNILSAYMFAAIPAILAALAYAILASAMPRAGGSYIFASRAISPYLGFVASFSQWFGLSTAIGVVAYVTVPFMRDIAIAMEWQQLAILLEQGAVRVGISLIFLWVFVFVNILGIRLYLKTLIPMMFLMFILGSIVIVTGFYFDHADFAVALAERGITYAPIAEQPFSWAIFLSASAVLFSSFIGFDSIAQAGSEAVDAERSLPAAIGITILTVGTFYMLFIAAVYHAVPWAYIQSASQSTDITAPGLLGFLLPPGLTVLIIAGAVVALINDIPAMLLGVSRLMFAWAEDGIFPKSVAAIHPQYHTPYVAIIMSGLVATGSIAGSHLAGDFFLGVDILVTAMLFNFLIMTISVLALPRHNPALAAKVRIGIFQNHQRPLAISGMALLTLFFIVHIYKDLQAELSAWYFHSTALWLIVMIVGSMIYVVKRRALSRTGIDMDQHFKNLPPE